MTDQDTRLKIILRRIRAVLPALIVAIIFAAGVWAITHLLREVNIHDVVKVMQETPVTVFIAAFACMIGSYVAMIGYDWSALKYLGKSLPLPLVSTGAFLGYAIGNSVGGGPVTGGAVRYRIYSALGLSVAEIATIAMFGTVSFSLGMFVIGCGALTIYPHALDPLTSISPLAIRLVAGAVMSACLLVLGFLAVRKSEFTFRRFKIRAPSPRMMLGQAVFTTADFLLAGSTLFLLLPHSDLGFAPFLAVFMVAILAGVASHVPGGVGVFETVVIAALPASVPLEHAAAGLLLYRVIYYIIPFLVALIILAIHQSGVLAKSRLGATVQTLSPVFQAISSVIPLATSAMAFGAGAYMLVAPLIPSSTKFARDLNHVLPLGFLESGALLSSAAGAALVVIAHGLFRRIEGAWWLTQALLLLGISASFAHGIDYQTALFLGLMFLILLPMRSQFRRSTRLTRNVLSPRWILMLACLVLVVLAVLFFSHKATPYGHDLWWQFATDKSAPRALRATFVGLVALTIVVLVTALRPGRFSHELATPEMLERANKIIRAQGDPEANIALTGDKSLLFSESGKSFLMYRIQGRTWIALHEPFGEQKELIDLAWEFYDAAYAANARPVFYSVSATSVPIWLELGLSLVKMGEAAIVPLGRFGLEGKERKKLRTSHNRAIRDGFSFEIINPVVSVDMMETLKVISDDWLTSKSGGEKGFSIGTFDPDLLAKAPIAIVSFEGRIVAFANLWMTEKKERAAIDLMRHVSDAPSGLMEFLFTELMLYFKSEGFEEFSLGNAPLAGLEGTRSKKLSARLGALVYRHGRQFYNFEGLRMFKNKFAPDWRPVYIALPPNTNVLGVAKDVVALIGGGIGSTLKQKKT